MLGPVCAIAIAVLALPSAALAATKASAEAAPAAAAAVKLEPSMSAQALLVAVLDQARHRLDQSWQAITDAPAEARALGDRMAAAWDSGDGLRAATFALVLLMIGGGAEWLYWCYAGRAARAVASAAASGEPPTPTKAALLGSRRAVLQAFALALSLIGVVTPSSAFAWPPGVQEGVVGGALAVALVRAVWIVSTFLLSPHQPRLRLLPLPSPTAERLHALLLGLSVILGSGWALHSLLNETLRLPGLAVVAADVSGILASAIALALVRLWWRTGRAGRGSSAALLPVALTAGVLLCLVLFLLGVHEAIWIAALVAATASADKAAGVLVDTFTAQRGAATEAAATFRPLLHSAARIVVFVGAAVIGAVFADLPLLEMSRSDSAAGRLLARSLDVVVIILIADLVWVWARTLIDRRLALAATSGELTGGRDPRARLATLLPLLRKVILVTLLGVIGLISLSALGVDIAPLLAGAGVLGIAIGFGAQTLVRDIVSGVFYLVEDAFRVGEYVEFGQIRGTVEGISLRFLRIRHHRGAVHTIPFGEIKWLTNYSRDWAITKLQFRVPFDTDVLLIKKLVKKIAADVAADPELGPYLIEPLKSQGVIRMEEFCMVIGVKYMTRPGDGQFIMRREAYHRILEAFEDAGIRLADRNVRVATADEPGDLGPKAPRYPQEILAAAAEIGALEPRRTKKSS
jgi:moderate conductance mechanosensitive channel